MTIICAVAADFVNSDGDKFSVTAKEIGLIKEAPEWIKKTLLFKWLASDGSIKYVTKSNRIEAENDPLAGLNAEGKEIPAEDEKGVNNPVEAEEKASEKPKTKSTRQKKEKKDDA